VAAARETVDLERFLRSRVTVRNDGGGRGYDTGLRTFDCPLCGDSRGRGWLGVSGWGAGCFNTGCVAEPRLDGGAAEWARRVLGLPLRSDAVRHLVSEFGGGAPVVWAPPPRPGPDFCRFPLDMRPFAADGSSLQSIFEQFMLRQWGVTAEDARRWGLGWCLRGPHAWRVVVPVVVGGAPVGFQARAVRGAEPKYVTSRHGPHESDAECARPASSMLFNIDAVRPGEDAVMVEGAGDVMAWRSRAPTAFALLGVALTPAKLDMVRARAPSRVVVALDDEPAARERGLDHVDALAAWDVPATLGRWVGGKDAGEGAILEEDPGGGSVLARVARRLRA